MQPGATPSARADLGAGLFVVLLGALALWQAMIIPVTPIYAQVGPKAVPYVVAAGLLLLGAGLVREALRGGWSRELPEMAEAPPTNWRALALIGAGLLSNLVLIQPLGFTIAATAQFTLVAAAFGSRRILRDLLIAFVVALGSYLLFSKLLDVNIGAGVVERAVEGLFGGPD